MSEEKSFDDKVKECIEEIRPMLQRDGGDCKLISINGKTVTIKFRGACCGCPGAAMTLKMGIEKYMREKIPEIEEVLAAN